MFWAENGGKLRGRFNAILQRDHERCRADHKPHISGSLLHLPSFYAEENHVYRTDLRGIVGGFGRLDDDLANRRFDA